MLWLFEYLLMLGACRNRQKALRLGEVTTYRGLFGKSYMQFIVEDRFCQLADVFLDLFKLRYNTV
jgi:hypothetical protein